MRGGGVVAQVGDLLAVALCPHDSPERQMIMLWNYCVFLIIIALEIQGSS